jgi:SAM-dependent methyltransferase
MGRWSRRVAPSLVAFAGVTDGDRVLDVGSGTGALTVAVLGAAPTTRVVGLDVATPYLDEARERLGGERASFQEGDAQDLAFADDAFDKTLSLLAFNFIPDSRRALAELVRVTKPGGVIAAAVWDYGDGMRMLRVFWDEAVALDPASEPRDERHMPLCRSGELAELWAEHGLADVETSTLVVELSFASFDDYWAPFLAGQGPAGSYVAGLPDDHKQALERRLRDRLLDDGRDRPLTLSARAWAVKGRVALR